MHESPTIVWFRRDLRLSDNPALRAAMGAGGPIIPVYIDSRDHDGKWSAGAASEWWLHHSLKNLAEDLRTRDSRLILRRGQPRDVLDNLIDQTGAKRVYWNRRYEPDAINRDMAIKSDLQDRAIDVQSFNGSLLFEPWEIETGSGGPYQVYTPFWKSCLQRDAPAEPLPRARAITAPKSCPDSLDLDELKLLPKLDWDSGLYDRWTPGESGAGKALSQFLEDRINSYKTDRDIPSERGTSSLSPHLHFGEISPRQVWHAVVESHGKPTAGHPKDTSANTFISEIGWREFAHHVLYHFPKTPNSPLRKKFDHFPWDTNRKALKAWQTGQTGYPIVDAGMRELWTTGWMHNRVRMIVGSFLTKDLLLSWKEGAKWFWDTLVDADLANNTLGWQWISGCGADAAPYFRIFNPVSQGGKFDPKGAYVRKWVPEIEGLPDKYIHKPWDAPENVLSKADITLGETYPEPIVDHKDARKNALEAFDAIKGD